MLLFTLNIDMSNIIEWNVGLNGYKKCTLEIGENNHKFTTELLDNPFDNTRNITDIFNDHLSIRQSKYVEVLYSGGLDSELVLLHCLKNNIPVIAITMVIRINGLAINTHDLYYSEKFCRLHNVTQKLIDLHADKFFENGDHYKYLTPYYITEPHVATHFWLLEQCQSFPILGGDWPWVHMNKTDKILSPFRLEFSSYERFMVDKGITGIGNMISYSLESSCKLIKIHLNSYISGESVSNFKSRMYQTMYPELESRLRSYGWEQHRTKNFNILLYKIDLLKKLKPTIPHIKWNNTIKTLLNTTLNENDKFK
jgi:hypothetical protein